MNQTNQAHRVNWIDALKGFTMLSVIIGHVIGEMLRYMALTPTSFSVLLSIRNVIYSFHMPLFFILSGYVFDMIYVIDKKLQKTKAIKQMINCLLVYFIWSIIFCVFKMITDNSSTYTWITLIKLPYKCIAVYWYIYVLSLCYFISIIFYEKIKENKLFLCFLAVFSIVYYFLYKFQDSAGIIKLLGFYFFFYLGIFIRQKKLEHILASSKTILLNTIITILLEIIVFIPFTEVADYGAFFLSGTLCAITASLLLIGLSIRLYNSYSIRSMEWIGLYSIELYVMQIVSVAYRIVEKTISTNNLFATLFISCLICIIIPIFASYIAKIIKIHTLLFKPVKLFDNK